MKARWMAGQVIMAIACAASPVLAQERLIHQEVDPNTTALVQVFKTATGGRIDLTADNLVVSKSISGKRTETTISSGADKIVIAVEGNSVTTMARGNRVSAALSDKARMEQVRLSIERSAVARRAADLIGRLGLSLDTPVVPVLMSTRAFILTATGASRAAVLEPMTRWVKQASAPKPIVLSRVASQMRYTSTDCWNLYVKDAISIWDEYEDCMNQIRWYDVIGTLECTFIYDLRAIGAFSWWTTCVALR